MNPNSAVGILGGGQLARMLVESAFRLGLRPIILAESPQDPAAQLCPQAIFGKLDDEVVLRRFFAQVPLTVFENEFVDCDLLESCANGKSGFIPGLAAIKRLQDKLNQKELLQELKIPTAEFDAFAEKDLKAWVTRLMERYSGQVVFKWAKFGYDGKGTLIAPATPGEALSFCEKALKSKARVFAEKKIRFRRELALVSSYSTTGELVSYPLVISQQQTGICKLVTGPATALGVGEKLQKAAEEIARKIALAAQLHGTFAIEFFETEDGGLAVNELAPRVHNSGHFTLNASATSQFENHWRAVLGMPLGPVATASAFAMLNLLGPAGIDPTPVAGLPTPSAHSSLHWYGKTEVRAGRKMGHLNGHARSPEELNSLTDEMKAAERRWIDGLKT